ncbi:hypothetical protein EQG64_20290 [Streptomyces sp. S6]|nr:hypothetical protein EQG64_20290 [Streptomyces sp. S6]
MRAAATGIAVARTTAAFGRRPDPGRRADPPATARPLPADSVAVCWVLVGTGWVFPVDQAGASPVTAARMR